jgi:hypothetical protein
LIAKRSTQPKDLRLLFYDTGNQPSPLLIKSTTYLPAFASPSPPDNNADLARHLSSQAFEAWALNDATMRAILSASQGFNPHS